MTTLRSSRSYLSGVLALFQRVVPDKSRQSPTDNEDVVWIRLQELPSSCHHDNTVSYPHTASLPLGDLSMDQYYIIGYESGVQVCEFVLLA
jgi:hypothetical protein